MTRRPFFGSSGAVAPARMDMRVATEPGRAYRDLFDNLGRLGGALLKDYGDTKKKRQEDKGFIKGVQPILNEIGKGDPMLGDVLKAAKERLNDPEIPLSQRKSEAVSMLQTLSFAQNYRDKQSQISTRERNIRLEEDLGALKKRESDFKTFLDQQNMSVKYAEYLRDLKKDQMEADIDRLALDQTVRPVLNESGEPMPDLFRRGKDLLTKDPSTGRFSVLGTRVENVVDVDQTPIATPTIKMVDPERGFRGTIPRQIEDIIQSTARKIGIGTIPDNIFFKGGKEKLTASQRITTIGRTLEPLLMKTFGGKMTDYQIKRIEQSIPLPSDDEEEGMAKMAETVGLLRDQLNRANDAIGTLNPKTEAFAEALSTKKGIEANLPIIEEIVNKYYGNIPTSGIGTMGQSPNVDALLESLPRDTNRSRTDLDVTDILSQ